MADKFSAMPSITDIVDELHSLSGEFQVSRIDNARRIADILISMNDIQKMRDVSVREAELWFKMTNQLEQITHEELRVIADFNATIQRVIQGLELQVSFLLSMQTNLTTNGKFDSATQVATLFRKKNKGKKK